MSDLPGFHMLEGGKRKDESVVEDSRMRRFMIILSALLILSPAAGVKANPIEIGAVQWGHDLSKALRMSAETGRPVFVLFQEVPGCSGCQDFGRTVLTNPLVVEAVEDEFLPVLVFNNQGGEDRRLLDRFGEPAWNFQVVRFLNAQGSDIIPRRDRVWTVHGIATRMIAALRAVKRPVPKYLHALAEESDGEMSDRNALPEDLQAIYDLPGLTDTQKVRIEGLISVDESAALEWLSPRQRRALQGVE